MAGVTRKDVAPLTEPPIAQESAAAVKAKPAHKPASFGMCEGVRDELERTGKSTDPFTGKPLTRDDLK